MSIGTKIGASMPHLPLAEPMKMLTKPVRIMMPTIVIADGSAIALSTAAPCRASSVPRFDAPNA